MCTHDRFHVRNFVTTDINFQFTQLRIQSVEHRLHKVSPVPWTEQDWKRVLFGVHYNFKDVLYTTSRAMSAGQLKKLKTQQWRQSSEILRSVARQNMTHNGRNISETSVKFHQTIQRNISYITVIFIFETVRTRKITNATNNVTQGHCCKNVNKTRRTHDCIGP
jgi:hypothetical protein